MLSTWSRIRSTGRSAWPTAKVVTAPSRATSPTAPMRANSMDRPSAVVSTRVATATRAVYRRPSSPGAVDAATA